MESKGSWKLEFRVLPESYFCPKELLTDLYKCAFLASSACVPGLVLFLVFGCGTEVRFCSYGVPVPLVM